MQTPTIPLLFLDGIISISAMCFQLLIPVIFLFIALLSWEKISKRDEGFLSKVLFLGGITILMLDGVYLVYLVLSYPHSDMAKFYLSYRKEAGIVIGVLLLFAYGYRFLKFQEEKLFPSYFPFISAALFGLLVTSIWAPCIRESVASISTQDSGRLLYFVSYISGLTLPFLALALVSFGLKFLAVTQEKIQRFSSIGIILLILLSLTKILIS